MSKATLPPAPWTVTKHIKALDRKAKNDYPGAEVSFFEEPGERHWHEGAIQVWSENADAIATLISRAPALRDALRKCAAILAGEGMSKQELVDALTEARAALDGL